MNGLKIIMGAKTLENKDVADKLGVTPQAVANWITGKRNISDKYAIKLAEWFKIDRSLIVKNDITEEERARIFYDLGYVVSPVKITINEQTPLPDEPDEEYKVTLENDNIPIEQLSFDLKVPRKNTENQGTLDDLLHEVSEGRRSVKVDEFTVTISELANMYKERGMLDIHPEFQRMYRWSSKQKSRLIESILLGIPIPPIFVAENDNAEWDVIDGVQRLSTFFQFMGILFDEEDKWVPAYVLEGTQRLPSLKGKVWDNEVEGCGSSFAFRNNPTLTNKFLYSKINVIKINNESSKDIKYDLFDRLNSGGTKLTPQELRNSLAIMLAPEFYTFLRNLSVNPDFINTLPLGKKGQETQADLEYVLRFFAYRHFKKDVDYRLTDDISEVLTSMLRKFCEDPNFNKNKEKEIFDKTFELLNKALGENVFKKYYKDGNSFKYAVMLTSFELIAIGVANNLDYILGFEDPAKFVKNKILNMYSEDFYIKAKNIFSSKSIIRATKLIEIGTEYFSHE